MLKIGIFNVLLGVGDLFFVQHRVVERDLFLSRLDHPEVQWNTEQLRGEESKQAQHRQRREG